MPRAISASCSKEERQFEKYWCINVDTPKQIKCSRNTKTVNTYFYFCRIVVKHRLSLTMILFTTFFFFFFLLYDGAKAICIQYKLCSKFCIFIFTLVSCVESSPLLWFWASAGVMVHTQPRSHESTQLILATYHNLPLLCSQTTILFFTFSTVLNKLHELLNCYLVTKSCPTLLQPHGL